MHWHPSLARRPQYFGTLLLTVSMLEGIYVSTCLGLEMGHTRAPEDPEMATDQDINRI